MKRKSTAAKARPVSTIRLADQLSEINMRVQGIHLAVEGAQRAVEAPEVMQPILYLLDDVSAQLEAEIAAL